MMTYHSVMSSPLSIKILKLTNLVIFRVRSIMKTFCSNLWSFYQNKSTTSSTKSNLFTEVRDFEGR